ncbi:Uncharacterised protein [Stutzerimonas stutzeri]|nr:Uncharacterised protein [Stutzerimonas stutzeri]
MKENAANNIVPGQFIRFNAVLFQEFNAVLFYGERNLSCTKPARKNFVSVAIL